MRRLHDPEFAPPIRNPYVPGRSAFQQKGAAFLADLEYANATTPGGSAAVLKAMTDEGNRAYMSQRFFASEWYDAYPCLYFHVANARAAGQTFEEHRRRVGIYHANSRGSLYRALLHVVSNEAIARWGPRAVAIYWNFGKTETSLVGPNEVCFIRRGTPKGLLQWTVWAAVSFTEETLRASGAKKPATEIGLVESEGTLEGQELCRISIKLTW